jgi:hypothetical protein
MNDFYTFLRFNNISQKIEELIHAILVQKLQEAN